MIIHIITIFSIAACNGKKEEKQEASISAISIIKGQLNKLDSSLYAFMKLERNGNRTDTTFLKREEVRAIAAPFLFLPDITSKDYYKNYTEERLIDAEQNTLNITSTLKEDKTGEIQKQIVVVGLSDVSNGQVQSIFIDRSFTSADSTVDQKLFWQIDKYFSIGSIVTKEKEPEKTYYTKVEWQ